MDLLNKAEELFGSRNLYEILSISKEDISQNGKLRGAYLRAAMKYHPDKAKDDECATEKFQILAKIYELLQDEDTRKYYNDTGKLPDEDAKFDPDRYSAKLTEDMIQKFKKDYIGSEAEKEDFIKHYNKGKGSLIHLFDNMFFVNVIDDLDRVKQMISDAIEAGEVEAFEEPRGFAAKWKKYLANAKQEAEEAEEMLAEIKEKYLQPKGKKRGSAKTDGDSLESMILARRQQQSSSFLEQLEAKYSQPEAQTNKRKRSSKK